MIESSASSTSTNISDISDQITQTDSSIEQVGGSVNSYQWVNKSSAENDRKFAQAVREMNYDVAEFMISHDMVRNFGYKDKNNSSPMHHLASNATDKRARSIMKSILLKSPPSNVINGVDNSGDTPLIISVRAGDSKMANNLIKKGADMNIRNTRGEVVVFNTEESPISEISDVDSTGILSRLKRDFLESPTQEGGGSVKGERTLNFYPQPMSSGKRDNKASIVHNEVVSSIMGLLKVDEITAKGYKSIIYKEVKEANPNLKGLDRANKLKEDVTMARLKTVDKTKLAEVVKDIKRKIKEREENEKENEKKKKENEKKKKVRE